MYENYVFDLYGTLVDIHTDEEKPEVWEKLALFYGYYGAWYTSEALRETYEKLVNSRVKSQKGDTHEAYPEIKIEQVFLTLFEQKGVPADITLGIHAGQFFRILTTEYIRLYDGVPDLLSALRGSGKRIYLLSNAQRIFTEYEMNLLGIAGYFDEILISSDYGTKKPDSRFFHQLLEQTGIHPEESIMIGNDAVCDIAGAKKIGMDTYYIHSNISPECPEKPDATFCQMEMDIAKVCENLIK